MGKTSTRNGAPRQFDGVERGSCCRSGTGIRSLTRRGSSSVRLGATEIFLPASRPLPNRGRDDVTTPNKPAPGPGSDCAAPAAPGTTAQCQPVPSHSGNFISPATPAGKQSHVAVARQPAHCKSFDNMRNLRSLRHGRWRPPPGTSFLGEPPAACCWDPAKDDVVVAFGPSARDAYIRLLRLSEHVTATAHHPSV